MILLTGANGLIGSQIATRFLSEGKRIRALRREGSDLKLVKAIETQIEWVEGDIRDVVSLEQALAGCDTVIHAAAKVSFSPSERNLLYQTNVEGTANVVNACIRMGISKLVYISSVAALGRPSRQSVDPTQPSRIDENQKWEESPLNTEYAKSKYQAELEVWRGVAEGLPCIIVNPSVVLGEGDWTQGSTALFKYVFDEKPFYSEGTLNYVDVKDVAEAVYQLTFSDTTNERYILNAGQTTYKTLFELIAKAMHKKPPRIGITPFLAEVAWRWEGLKARFTQKQPLVTKEVARSSQLHFAYQNDKIREKLQVRFQPLEATVQRISENLIQQ